MAVTYSKTTPIKVALPKSAPISAPKGAPAPDNNDLDQYHLENIESNLEDISTHTVNDSELLFDEITDNTNGTSSESVENNGVNLGGDIQCSTGCGTLAPTAPQKVTKPKTVPKARQVEYGGMSYPSLSKCLKALGLCRDRFKYVKRTRPELKTDKAIIGILMHERQKAAHQATSYVVAIKGEVHFFDYLTGACTRTNQLLGLSPDKALTQAKVSKYRYEHNRRPKNKANPITLQEAFTACLTRLLIKERVLAEADEAIFKARMATVAADLGEQDLFDVVGDDTGAEDALADLANQYHNLE